MLIGTRAWLRSNAIPIPDDVDHYASLLEEEGKTTVFCGAQFSFHSADEGSRPIFFLLLQPGTAPSRA